MTASIMRFIPPPAPGVPGCFLQHPRDVSAAELAALPVVVLIHGISRNAAEHVTLAGRTPGLANRVLVAPLFEQAQFGQYQQLGRPDNGPRCDLALIALLDHLYEMGFLTDRVTMFGFSGGAQFAHRFALFQPERLMALSLVAAGWYTMPDSDARWPLGLDTSGTGFPDARPLALLSMPVQIMVGNGDRLRGRAVRTSPAIDRLQGRHRVARAKRFHAALRAMADVAGIPQRTCFDLLTVERHGFGSYAERGRMLLKFADWLAESTSPTPVRPKPNQTAPGC